MGIRKSQNSDQPPPAEIHRSNMGSLAAAATLGAKIARMLDDVGVATAILDSDGFVRFVNPIRVTIHPPTEDEIIAKMVAEGATEEQILEMLEINKREWEKTHAPAR